MVCTYVGCHSIVTATMSIYIYIYNTRVKTLLQGFIFIWLIDYFHLKMGNCMDLLITSKPYSSSSSEDKIRVLFFDGEEEEFMASTTIEEITSSSGPYYGYKLVHHSQPQLPLSDDTKLLSGEVYFLLPEFLINCITNNNLIPPFSQKFVDTNDEEKVGGDQQRSIKIVLTKKQLQELLFRNNITGIFPNENFSGPISKNNCQVMNENYLKWKPALTTIPESSTC